MIYYHIGCDGGLEKTDIISYMIVYHINDIDYVHLCARVSVYTPVHMYVCT